LATILLSPLLGFCGTRHSRSQDYGYDNTPWGGIVLGARSGPDGHSPGGDQGTQHDAKEDEEKEVNLPCALIGTQCPGRHFPPAPQISRCRAIATTQALDTDNRNPASKFLLHVLGAAAEFET
jgi:hypothetical protein